MINLRYSGIKKFDIENGLGIGLTLFTQRCSKNCIGCHNPSTHSAKGGMEFTKDTLNEIIDFFYNNPQVKRCTLSGGDPLESLDLCELVLDSIKVKFPYLKIWIYTGFEFEFLIQHEKYKKVLNMCDILVDGKFEIENKDIKLKFRGSSNQRVINMPETLKQGKIIKYLE